MTTAYHRAAGMFARNRPHKEVFDSASLAAFLRREAPLHTCAAVAARAGLPVRTVERWLTTDARPSASHFLALVDAFGPSVIRAAFSVAPAWLDDAVRAEHHRRLEAEIGALQNELDTLMARNGNDAENTARRVGDVAEKARRT